MLKDAYETVNEYFSEARDLVVRAFICQAYDSMDCIFVIKTVSSFKYDNNKVNMQTFRGHVALQN